MPGYYGTFASNSNMGHWKLGPIGVTRRTRHPSPLARTGDQSGGAEGASATLAARCDPCLGVVALSGDRYQRYKDVSPFAASWQIQESAVAYNLVRFKVNTEVSHLVALTSAPQLALHSGLSPPPASRPEPVARNSNALLHRG